MRIFIITLSLSMIGTLSGCANFGPKLKSFLAGKPQANGSARPKSTYSKSRNFGTAPKRKYKRMTRQKLETAAGLGADAGSLWVSEGQRAYLFSQNPIRMVGDFVKVKVDGAAKKQLETKVSVIKDLIRKLEERKMARKLATQARKEASQGKAQGAQKKEKAGQDQAKNQDKKQEVETDFQVSSVPSRITERLADGNYRVKGAQSFMIGQREYKVVISGVVRADDFNDEGLSASALLDPTFDIVSQKRGGR